MNLKKLIGSGAVIISLFMISCQPSNSDVTVTVSKNVQASAPGASADVKDGVVILTGQVKDEASRMAAEDAAKKTAGVKSVVNNIIVMAAPEPTVTITPDAALQQGVNDAIKDYPEVTATVNDGEIILNGQIAEEKWKRLKMSLDGLNPKKVNAVSIQIK